MLVLPVPLVVALLLAFMLVRAVVRGETERLVLCLIGLCALQSVIIVLVQHYGVTALRPVQPITAMLLSPTAWLALRNNGRTDTWPPGVVWHLIGPGVAVLALFLAPAWLDVIVPLSFVAYGAAIVRATWSGADSVPGARLETGGRSARTWHLIGWAILASALSDVVIAASIMAGSAHWQPIIISLFSSVSLLFVGALVLSEDLRATPMHPGLDDVRTDARSISDSTAAGSDGLPDLERAMARDPQLSPKAESRNSAVDVDGDETAERALMENLGCLMRRESFYLDPDLSLLKLARKLGVPAKRLSAVINRRCGENVSRYVNRYRIEHACQLLAAGSTVAETVYASGFNTKSNFNREFQRVMSATPTEWLNGSLADQQKT